MAIFRVRDEKGNTHELPIVKGDPGYTPIKGEDYWTDNDKAEMREYIVEEMAEHTASTDNPHAVTKEQVGLGNVDNTSDADKPVSNLQAKAINDAKTALNATIAAERTRINNHIEDQDNPHGLTAADVGAAKMTHYHSALDITSGVMSVARGGTGRDSHTRNAVLVGNEDGKVGNAVTAPGAFYATELNGAPMFGTLPVSHGGTGKTTAEAALLNLGGIKIVKLWENASPTSSFALQTVQMDLSEYQMVLCLCRLNRTDATIVPSNFIRVGAESGTDAYGIVTGYPVRRTITATAEGVEFGAGCKYTNFGSSNVNADNTVLIPAEIYGFKGVM